MHKLTTYSNYKNTHTLLNAVINRLMLTQIKFTKKHEPNSLKFDESTTNSDEKRHKSPVEAERDIGTQDGRLEAEVL